MFLFSPLHAGIGLDLYIVEGAKPGFIYQVEAFDPEDTRQNTPLGVSLLAKLQRGFSVWSLTQEPGVSLSGVGWVGAVGGICCPLPGTEPRGGWNG